LSEAPSYGLPIAMYSADSKGAEAYRALAAELRRRDGRGVADTSEGATLQRLPAAISSVADPRPISSQEVA